jgi:acyl-CoA thioester hydrolase
MLVSRTNIRVRYGETDQMGYAYYGVYAQYYEVGRVEALRTAGFSYKEIEERGILMPVAEFSVTYKRPAYYDDEITVVTTIRERPSGARVVFHYECHNASGELLNTGSVTLACIDKLTGRLCRMPDWFAKAFDPFFT